MSMKWLVPLGALTGLVGILMLSQSWAVSAIAVVVALYALPDLERLVDSGDQEPEVDA
ncbi:hypothetical protein [Nocardiopsis algeriensis]|uniref:Uncharacterized protein n=1 Tax=Nocardiopsis algeriensis TaxID=1478215 RepID=A0A841IU54_9ACTN|nr:hypothetical protein [Nocardiopsis algeriensis]MBB6122203.1 hypothetical protein [Nocardiopsis algeriensis]